MSSDIKVYSGLGFIFDTDNESIIDKLKEVSPNHVASATYGDDIELDEFLWESSSKNSDLGARYPGLQLQAIDTISQQYVEQFVIFIAESSLLLYSKDEEVDMGAVTLEFLSEGKGEGVESLARFINDFNILEEPQVVLWRKWR